MEWKSLDALERKSKMSMHDDSHEEKTYPRRFRGMRYLKYMRTYVVLLMPSQLALMLIGAKNILLCRMKNRHKATLDSAEYSRN